MKFFESTLIIVILLQTRGPYSAYNLRSSDRRLMWLYMAYEVENDDHFRYEFRISRKLLQHILTILGPEINKKTKGWQPIYEILIFLYWLGSGSKLRILSSTFDVPLQSVERIIERWTILFNDNLLHDVIKLPNTDAEYEEIANGFKSKSKSGVISQCLGAIDGSHIRIICPTAEKERYFNRKQYTSMHVQAIVDHKKRFLNVYTGNFGSCHDQRVLTFSDVYKDGNFPKIPFYIIGDSGYANREKPPDQMSLVTPYRQCEIRPETEVIQRRFNTELSRLRISVEHSFGLLKNAERILLDLPIHKKLHLIPKIVMACCILHNLKIDVDGFGQSPKDREGETLPTAGNYTNSRPPQERPGPVHSKLRDNLAAMISQSSERILNLIDHDYAADLASNQN